MKSEKTQRQYSKVSLLFLTNKDSLFSYSLVKELPKRKTHLLWALEKDVYA
ncbi:Uncharacterised protein [Chlamydia abortus]|nr:hypothetical protein NVRI1_00833 [Chlamydia abortus]SFV97063.1 Uncharacterised protein [Chlamydia abortus]SFV99450.1 Uncharacterised protein [Chlamydia abortus]SFW02334.1 Uncharacterised protein [Chlamydia abortus]SFW03525.1 Uncharacterised protein [Chlamydia abortus]